MPHNQRSPDSVTKIAAPPGSNLPVLSITGTERLLVAGRRAYFHQAGMLRAIDRLKFAEAQTALSTTPPRVKSLEKQIGADTSASEALHRSDHRSRRWSRRSRRGRHSSKPPAYGSENTPSPRL